LVAAEVADFVFFGEGDEGPGFFAVFFAGDADDLDVFDAGHGVEEVFDFFGVYIFAAADDLVFDDPLPFFF
jgi:hypothetical protein